MRAGDGVRVPSSRRSRAMWSVVAVALVASITRLTMRVIAASPGFSDSGESILSEVALLGAVALLAWIWIVHRLARPANPFGWLLILVAGLLLATEWDIPGGASAGSLSAAAFSVGLLLTMAVAVAYSLLGARAMRRHVTGLVVDLHREAAAGEMRDALAEWLHDPSLEVAHAVGDTYRTSTWHGRRDGPAGASHQPACGRR